MKLFSTRLSRHYSTLIFVPLLLASSPHAVNENYVVDTKESLITWKGSMQFSPNSHIGYVYLSKGELVIENGKLSGGSVEADMNTITDEKYGSDNDLINHLKSPDFFDVKKFPTATFLVTNIETVSGANVNVTGNLTMKGITNTVTFTAKAKVNAGVAVATGKVVIDRSKWDVRYGSGKFFDNLADETISDDIELDLKIIAKK